MRPAVFFSLKEMCETRNIDGNEAVATAAYPFIDTSFLYPITPSTSAAEKIEEMSAQGKKNLFGDIVSCREMQAEGGVAGFIL